tara:strand:+ start:4733 stop:5170 length:438 start_codon:yes stop_codon:yes gene_type:complete
MASTLACGSESLKMHARAATVVGSSLSVVRAGIHEARENALNEAELETVGSDPETRLEAMERVARHFSPGVIAYNSVQAALQLWVHTLLAIAADEAGEGVEQELLSAASSLLRAWNPMAGALMDVGVEVPRLPSVVLGLVEEIGE